jgi:RHS repeat-associated protein
MNQTRNPKFESRNSKIETRTADAFKALGGHSRAALRRSREGGSAFVLAFLLLAVLLAARPASAQVITGRPPFGSFSGGPFDTVNNANLDVHFQIPMLGKAGRGLPFNYSLSFDSLVWYPATVSGSQVWTPVTNWGWGALTQAQAGSVSYSTLLVSCGGQNFTEWLNFTYTDPWGTRHLFVMSTNTQDPSCNPKIPNTPSATAAAMDGSGYTMSVTNYTEATVYDPSGDIIRPPPGSSGPSSFTDPNGNVVSASVSGSTTTFTDSLGMTVLTVVAPGGGASTTYTYTGPNGSATYTVMYSPFTIETNFGCSGVTEYGPTQQYLVSEIKLPDNTSYTFTYESTLGHSGNFTGRLASVTLPTGGTITYEYVTGNNGITCADGTTAGFYRFTPDTGSGNYWLYSHTESGTAWLTDIVDPQGYETQFNFQGIYETERQVPLGAPLQTVYTCYGGVGSSAPAFPCNSSAVTLPITQRVMTASIGGLESQTATDYDWNSSTGISRGLVTKIDEYDFGNGSVGAFKRETMTCYATLSNAYIQNRPQYTLIYNTTGNPSACTGTSGLVAEATYSYDSNGNLLTETRTNTGGSPSSISRSFTYGSYGVLTKATDFNNNPTTYSNFACANNTVFPETITSGGLSTTLGWNCNGAVVTSREDPNSQTTTFSYDTTNNFWRVAGIAYPDGGQTTVTYTDSEGAFSVATARLVSGALGNHTVTQYLDGLGRVDKSVDAQACSTVVTTYDSVGRVSSVSNPYCSSSSGATSYGYDALSRLTSTTYPDTAAASISYSGNCATTTDPASKMRTTCSDALGRVTSVTEAPNNLDYQTTYTYDDLNDLVAVAQSGQTRSYAHDMLGRLTSAKVPEVNYAGTQCSTTFGYDANGNLTSKVAPLENQDSSCSSTVTTTYAYNSLNQLTSKTYSDGTPSVSFSYGQSSVTLGSWSSGTLTNPLGRLTEATTTSSGSVKTGVVYSYDPVGRTSEFWQCNPSNCGASAYALSYTYDKAGDVTSWVHPDTSLHSGGFTLTNTINGAQQIMAIQSSWQDTSHPQYLAENVTYTAWGAVSQLQNGCVGSGCVNAQETYTYNNRLQPSMIQLTGTSNGGYCLVYNYYADESNPTSCSTPTQGAKNNGNVMGYFYQDSVQSGFSHTATYGYDTVNRLITAVATGNSTYNLNFNNYDPYGNMTCVQNTNTNGPCPQWSFNTSTNQLSSSTGCTYDAAGNLTKDCSTAAGHTYQWDAEGRVASVDSGSTWSFIYNALGERVQWAYSGGTNQQLFDPSGTWLGQVGSYDLVPWGAGYLLVYFGSETDFNHINNLSSTTARTNHAGTAVEDMLFYPWGDVWQSWGSGGYNFAEMPYYDVTTNTSITQFRLQSPNLGRWLSPDPNAGDMTNPQSLNRYAYVMNNPASNIDPTGQACYGLTYILHACDAFMDNVSLGWNWNEFDVMNILVTQAGPIWAPVAVWVPPAQIVDTIGGVDYPGPMMPGYWANSTGFFQAWADNASFLYDFLTGTGATDRYYGPNAPQTQNLMQSRAAQQMVALNRSQGCPAVTNFNRGVGQAAAQAVTDFGNPTQIQLGAFHAAITNYDGAATYTVMNTASMSSFLYHLTPESWNHNGGPLGNVYQVFYWSTPSPCQ